jgi:hypothetical protein
MKSLSQGDSSANSSDPDDELGPEYINESGLARILGRVTLVLFRRRRRDACSRLREGVRRRVRKSRQKEAAGAADAVLMQIEWSKRGL